MFGLRPGAEQFGLYVLVMTLTTICGATLMLLVGAREFYYFRMLMQNICESQLFGCRTRLQLARIWRWEMDFQPYCSRLLP